jgi:hypothetical protein
MRFRVGEDERRYGALRIEAYLRLLPLPAATVSEILRNWSKIEAILFWEGVKQGLAIGTLRAMDGRAPHEQLLHGASTAVAAHAAVYGEADTPLAAVETKHLRAIFADAPEAIAAAALHPWLSAKPVEFAPQTLAEFTKRYGVDAVIGAAVAPVLQAPPVAPAPVVAPEADGNDEDPDDRAMMERLQALIDQEDETAAERGEDRPPESPAFLDRVRDELLSQVSQGWKPSGWPELIMRLHLSMQVDASYLDLQLSSDSGRAVLAQAGLFNVFPGLGVIVDEQGGFGGVKST